MTAHVVESKHGRAERVIVARLGTERVALPAFDVLEVMDAPVVTPLPLTPSAVMGQCQWRGKWVPVLDPAAMVGVPRRDGHAGTALVVRGAAQVFALWVDDVDEVRELPPDGLRAVPPGTDKLGRLRGILQLEDQLIAVVDGAALLAAADATLQSEVRG